MGLVAEPDLPVGDSRCYHAIHGLLHLSLLPEELQAANQILRLVEHGYHGLSVLHLSGIFTVQLQFSRLPEIADKSNVTDFSLLTDFLKKYTYKIMGPKSSGQLQNTGLFAADGGCPFYWNQYNEYYTNHFFPFFQASS